jgi:three-Cys-motif partner protein
VKSVEGVEMKRDATLWHLEPHTLGKHLVLRRYLDAWFPIMGSWSGRILFVDGFAGPGKYADGEDGSPMIALKSMIEHRAKGKISAEVVFMFIEKDRARAEHLRTVVEPLRAKLPATSKVDVINGVFDDTLAEVLDQLDSQAKMLAPCFVMVDPFGVADTPMSVIQRVLGNPRSEVYISFMYEFINRFKGEPGFDENLDRLFGTPDWRAGMALQDPTTRKAFFYGLYERQLRRAGARYVVHFELYQANRLVYAIFFGTQSLVGCDRMKQAIWKVAPFGDFAFRSTRSGQLTLGLANSDYGPLRQDLRQHFVAQGWTKVETVRDFVSSDETDFHAGQFKRNALVPMEAAGEIEVDPTTRRKKRSFPPGTVLRFV